MAEESTRKRISNKLKSRAGESISETLVALLISALALVMLEAISAASRMVTNSRNKLDSYYKANNDLAAQTKSTDTGEDVTQVNLSITITQNGNQIYSSVDPITNSSDINGYVNNVFNNKVIAYKKKKTE